MMAATVWLRKMQRHRFYASYVLASVATLVFALPTSTPTQAGTILLDGIGGSSGWQASWDPSHDPFVQIVVDAVLPALDAVVIQKVAEFTQPPGFGGLIPAIPITFTQVDPNAVSRIVIADEVITNSTGVDWTDFHFELLDGGDAEFNAPDTDASAGGLGFFSSPFDNQMWGPVGGPPFTEFWLDGFGLGPGGSNAVVADGSQWFPGNGATDGELFIDTVLGDGATTPFTVFTLKETPTVIPEPSTTLLMVLGAMGLLGRRNRGSL